MSLQKLASINLTHLFALKQHRVLKKNLNQKAVTIWYKITVRVKKRKS